MDLYEAFVEAGGAKFIELLCLGMVRIGEHAACRNSLTIATPPKVLPRDSNPEKMNHFSNAMRII